MGKIIKETQIVRYQGKGNTYMEFGVLDKPKYGNEIYIEVRSIHKGGDIDVIIRKDEALMYIQGLALCLQELCTDVRLNKG